MKTHQQLFEKLRWHCSSERSDNIRPSDWTESIAPGLLEQGALRANIREPYAHAICLCPLSDRATTDAEQNSICTPTHPHGVLSVH